MVDATTGAALIAKAARVPRRPTDARHVGAERLQPPARGVDAPAQAHLPVLGESVPGALLDADLVSAMANRGCIHSFAANSLLMQEGDSGDAIFIIISGRVKAYSQSQGREVVHAVLGPHEYFGETSLDGGPRPISVVTLQATECAVVQAWQMRQVLAEHPGFAMQLLHKLIGQVRQTTAHVKALATVDVYGRIRALLLGAAEQRGGHWVVAEALTQIEIAQRVGCSREMVCRVLTELRRGGYVQRDGRTLRLLRALPERW